jgi:succinyl-diaminopimelate desuccinylase
VVGSEDDRSAALSARLLARTLELVDIASESGSESEIAEHVQNALRSGGIPVRDAGDTCLLAGVTRRRDRPLLLLAGHLDTVPAQQNWPGRLQGKSVLGVGASDMKGGLAIMLELALAGSSDGACDVGYLLFGREELPEKESALAPLLAREPDLRTADLAIMLEPTANTVQAGCLGNLDAVWTFRGKAGHSARPWLADSAIDRAVAAVQALHAIEPRQCLVEGLRFTQVISVTTLRSGIARNVIPGTAVAGVNFRYAPDVGAAEAEAMLRGWCEPAGEIELVGNSPGAIPPRENPVLERLRDISGVAVRAKQAWTPVAEFAAVGVEAVNFGPGDPTFAHRPDEQVDAGSLVRGHRVLESVLCA